MSEGFCVLMSFYSGDSPQYLRDALLSIQNQSIKPNQLVLVQDGPVSNELMSVLNEFNNKLNIKLVKLANNVGLGAALNAGLKYCDYELIARMDSDDISNPDRFKLQIEFMTNHPSIAVCGGYMEEFDESMLKSYGVRKYPTQQKYIYRFAKIRPPFSHVTVMYRKSIILSVGGYPDFFPEDYALWTKILMKNFQCANIPKILVSVRTGKAFLARRGLKFFKGEAEVLAFQYHEGFITTYEYNRNLVLRYLLRTLPVFIRYFLYSLTRN